MSEDLVGWKEKIVCGEELRVDTWERIIMQWGYLAWG